MGLPEVNLGLLPGGGGTQRLPRLAGPSEALKMMLTGSHVPAQKALNLGIVNSISDDVVAESIKFIKEVAEKIIGKSFGRLTVITNYRLKLSNKFNVSPNCFYPKPKITSSVLHLSPITTPSLITEPASIVTASPIRTFFDITHCIWKYY